MKITNVNNLPSAFVNLSDEIRVPVAKHYSATTLLKSVREVQLERRHFDEITIDVSDRVWLIFGTAVHRILEARDKTGFAEVKLEAEIGDGYQLTGIPDIYNAETFAVEDYKTASVWKVIYSDFADWRKQGLIYAWLLSIKGLYVEKLRFHALLKDWTANEHRLARIKGKFYPEHPVWTWEYKVTSDDLAEIKEFIWSRFETLRAAELLPDNELPLCTLEERWNSGSVYAVNKNADAKRALRLFDNEKDAIQFAAEVGGVVRERKGSDRKCMDYCSACEFCDYYIKEVKPLLAVESE